jgi:adenylate cyclase
VVNNLETRLLLLRKRLLVHQAPLQIDKVGRGRVALRWQGPLQLIDA